jgi:hypothetical protein
MGSVESPLLPQCSQTHSMIGTSTLMVAHDEQECSASAVSIVRGLDGLDRLDGLVGLVGPSYS